MDLTRFFIVYIAQGLVFLICVFLAFKTIRRDRKRLNLIFGLFYICIAFGLFINFIYAPFGDAPFVLYLNFITNYSLFLCPIFIVIFNLILLKSEKVITAKKQLIIIVIYGVIVFGTFFLLFGVNTGVEIGAAPKYSPVWFLPFYLYAMIAFNLAWIAAIYLAMMIYKKFEDEQLKKKWKFWVIGILELLLFGDGNFTMNLLNIDMLRTLWGIIGLILVISGSYLLYYGVGKQLS